MKVKNSLFRKIFIFSISIVIFTVFVNYILNLSFIDSFYLSRKKNALTKIVHDLKHIADDQLLEDFIENVRDSEGIDIIIVNEDFFKKRSDRPKGNPRTPNGLIAPKNRNYRMEPFEKREKGKFYTDTYRSGVQILSLSQYIGTNRIAILNTSLSVMTSHKHEMNVFNIITTIVAIFLSSIIGRLFSKRITKNIAKVNTVAKKISVLDFSDRLNIDSEDEIGELSKSINTMSESLEASIENLKAFASNASHELRTPITVINTHAQGLLNGTAKSDKDKISYYKAIAKKSNEMSEIVENLLTISRLSSPGIRLNYKEINIVDLIEESIEKYEFIELEKDIEWDVKVKKLMINCDPKLFKIAIDNIVQNALKYSKEEEKITVSKEENKLIFANTIQGKISCDLVTLWDPFSRGDNATDNVIDGKGLGLSIIKKIIEVNDYKCGIEQKENLFLFFIDLAKK
ncbi:HAMP domain-containing sensor histidine kinase [Fusobacterium sp. PH5-44]|uniref:HAMP domain-containing sensor histidine kinase n=1 Tax=unclassified Fusobacterium TaxID=2648384 RepID=UPI003D228D61